MGDMATAKISDRIKELGKLVRARRAELGYSAIGKAAVAAGLGVGTWGGVERGERRKTASNYAAIDRVLGWRSGSCEAFIEDGVRPSVRPGFGADDKPVVTELSTPGDRLLIVAAGWTDIDELTQRHMVEMARAAHEKAQGGGEGDNRAAR